MFRILESQAPAKQTASDTISTLSGRLQSATLLEDRRAAILGLRSFAKLYPASVASGALRNLITSLSSDGEDVDTSKVVLETLLMLFNPDESSPEASEDIALWLADEFTQRQENITILLDLLDRHDFFLRLYALQLISAISSLRADRTQECVYTAPLGISRLVSVLDDKREAIRSEGLLLLVAITPASQDLQKLVAFENAFDRIFNIIEGDGSLSNGGVVVQDCLSLLANLLRLNVSNQSYFRETGGVGKVALVLKRVLTDAITSDTESAWFVNQRDKNLWGFLSIIRLFLTGGGVGTQVNQIAFWQNGVVFSVLDIAFHESMAIAVRSEAFLTCADMIRLNNDLQEGFAQRNVTVHAVTNNRAPSLEHKSSNGPQPGATSMNIIQALLDISLAVSSQSNIAIRLSACECIKSYIYGHELIRLHFLRRAQEGHSDMNPEPDNILTILLHDADSRRVPDAYRHWIASLILFHLLCENFEAKQIAMAISEGDAEKGEEVVTCIQALSGILVSSAQGGVDDRMTIGYLMVLSGWLFEDPDAVNDFLQEGTNVQELIQLVLQPSQHKVLQAGLSAFLLGIIYEFSSKDSPIPRSQLFEILTNRLGREQYNDKMTKLREHPSIRDFEILSQGYNQEHGGDGLDIYFDKTFVNFFKDNFSRISRAIERDPNIEVSVLANGVQKGISRELVDSLRSQLDEKVQNMQKVEAQLLTLERKLGQEQADHRKTKESWTIELGRIKNINESLHRNHEDEMCRTNQEHDQGMTELTRKFEARISASELAIHEIEKESDAAMMKIRSRNEAELSALRSSVSKLEKQLEKSSNDHAQDLSTAHEEYLSNKALLEAQLERANERVNESDILRAKAEKRLTAAEASVQEKEEARATAQAELDDLLMVLGDMEDKRAKDKQRLKELGEIISDDEDDEGPEGEVDGENGDEDGEEDDLASATNLVTGSRTNGVGTSTKDDID